jgi:hypothetical protein
MNLVETLGVEIGVRQAGTHAGQMPTPWRTRSATPGSASFPRVRSAPGHDADGRTRDRWRALGRRPCIYSNPTDGTVEGRVRRLGTHSIGGFFPEADVFAVEDQQGGELARLLMSPFGGAAIPFLSCLL